MYQEQDLIVDTATSVAGMHRSPSGNKFIPVGHVGLRHIDDDAKADDQTQAQREVRLVSLYVSWYAECPQTL